MEEQDTKDMARNRMFQLEHCGELEKAPVTLVILALSVYVV